MASDIEQIILDELKYLRNKLDALEQSIHGIMWKVVGIGAGSGTLGFVVALIVNRVA